MMIFKFAMEQKFNIYNQKFYDSFLNLIRGGKLESIVERKWFKNQDNSYKTTYIFTMTGFPGIYLYVTIVAISDTENERNYKQVQIVASSNNKKIAEWTYDNVLYDEIDGLKSVINNTLGIQVDVFPHEIFLPDNILQQLNKTYRLVKPKDPISNAKSISLKIISTGGKSGQDNYLLVVVYEDLETGKKSDEKVLSSEPTAEKIIKSLNKYIEMAKRNKYKVEGSIGYIPEGANKNNWDFINNIPMSAKAKYYADDTVTSTSKDNKIIKQSQDFQGYFTGNIPDYAIQYIGGPSVDASQVSSVFGKTNEAIDLVNKYDPSLLSNISFIFNFSKGGAYGVYLSELDRAIKTKALQKRLESKGYDVKPNEQGLLVAYSKDNSKDNEQIQKDIDYLYKELESKGGTAIGINMSSVLNASRQDASNIQSQDPNLWEWLTILHLASTIVHEAVHAKGYHDEAHSETAENNFTQWALPIINNKYRDNLKSQGKEELFNPLIVTTNKRMASSNKHYKISQSWYTVEVAETTKDPKILTDILRMDKNDWVSRSASRNPNTPPEVLAEVLRRGKDDNVSYYAAKNPNCPPEALTEVLRRGKNDLVSRNAAQNPNTPPEALVEVLRRGEDDLVSRYASKNPNTPPKALIDWMRATGKIGKEDPKKHIIEYDDKEEEVDEDLEKLRKLISNNGWYKKAQLSYYFPSQSSKDPIGSDLQGRHSLGIPNQEGVASWAMMMHSNDNLPIESRLSREYMSEIPKDLSQEHDIYEVQLRKYVREYEKNNPNENTSELLSRDYDDARGYLTLEGLLEEKRVKPLITVIKKNASNQIQKIATVFGWMNNLDYSDGSTIPGLGDRVMAWDDRDEDFAWSEDDIRRQTRYNPSYDIKGFYYRWIEPRFRPQSFDDLTRDYDNTHPALRFASEENKEISKILSLFSLAKSKINNKNIKATRFVASKDILPFIIKIIDGSKYKVLFNDLKNEDLYSIWLCAEEVNDKDVENVEKYLLGKIDGDNITKSIENIFGTFNKKDIVDDIIKEVKVLCKSCNVEKMFIIGQYPRAKIENNFDNIDSVSFVSYNGDTNIKIGEMLARKLGIRNYKIVGSNNGLVFNYNDIRFLFSGNYFSDFVRDEIKHMVKEKLDTVISEIYNMDFTVNMLAYDILQDKMYDFTKTSMPDIKQKILNTFFDSDSVCRVNPVIILRAIEMAVKNDYVISDVLEKAIMKNVPLLSQKYTKEQISFIMNNICKSNINKANELLKKYRIIL